MTNEELEKEIELRELCIYYTVEYFKTKTVTQDIFIRHLENTYQFMKNGKIIV